jgi:hypothetical protein
MGRRTAAALALTCAFTVLIYTAFWTIGPDSNSNDPVQPWFELSLIAAFALGWVSDRWRYLLVCLVVLPIGLGPQMGTPGSDADTLNTLWPLVGPIYAVVIIAPVIAVGLILRKVWNWRRRRVVRSGGALSER